VKRFTLTLRTAGALVAMQDADEASLPGALAGLEVALIPGDQLTIECRDAG
jgi:hypothetical protein